jgi:peptidyl-tRNA hydrolase, PTH1 family
MAAGGKLIAGLGNPGERYARSRHNLGFRLVAELARRRGVTVDGLECNAWVGGDAELLLAMPQTFMNRSGYALRCLVERHGLAPADVLVAYDDVNLPLGRLRLRRGGSPGGHRGMESVIASLRTEEVARLRMGVAAADGGPAGDALVDFVLAPFAADEEETVAAMVQRAADVGEAWLGEGAEAAMNRYNG